MTPAFADAIALAHDVAGELAHVAVADYCAELRFATPAERDQWLSPLLRREALSGSDLSIAVIAGQADRFGHLRPRDGSAIQILEEGRFVALWEATLEILHLYDRETRRGLLWLAAGTAPGWVRSRPLLPLVHSFLLDTPWVPLHAAGVGLNGSFLTLAGGAGVGKTTAALACAMAGWDYAGDDFALIDSEGGRVAPLYSSARTRSTAPAAMAGIIDQTRVAITDTNGDLRSELRLADHAIGSRVRGGAIKAWLLPQRRGAPSPVFAPSSVATAYGALMNVTTSHLPFGRQSLSTKVLRALRNAPVHAVDTGTDPELIPGAFAQFLDGLRA